MQLADINLAVTVQSPHTFCLHSWRNIGGFDIGSVTRKSANPPNIIPRQYFQLYSNSISVPSLPQAFSGPCLLDCIQLDLTDVDVFSACKVPLEGDNFKIVRQVWRTSQTSKTSLLYCTFSEELHFKMCIHVHYKHKHVHRHTYTCTYTYT